MTYYKKRADQFYVQKKTASDVKFPRNCLVELTSACNHACVFCHNPFMHRTAGIINKELYGRFVDEAVELGLKEIGLYSTGEPFVVKNLAWYIKRAKDAGCDRVYLTSNGALATLNRVADAVENGLDSLKFSINAGTRESYKLTHGVDDFELVLQNVKDIFRWKQKNDVNLQLLGSCIYTRLTKNEVDIHRNIFSQYFEDIIYQQAQSQGGRTGERISPVIEQSPWPVVDQIKPCEMLWNRVHLTWEGYLSACCVDYELDLTYADLKTGESLSEIWNNVKIQALRQRHINTELDGLICKSCLTGRPHDYKPISDFRGKTRGNGSAEADTVSRINIVSGILGAK